MTKAQFKFHFIECKITMDLKIFFKNKSNRASKNNHSEIKP